MTSYTRDFEDVSGLPSIKRSSVRRSLQTLEDEVEKSVRFSSIAPSSILRERSDSPTFYPRPPSPTQSRRMMAEMQEQLRKYKEEVRKKDSLIQQLSSVESPSNSSRLLSSQRNVEAAKLEVLFGAERMSAETARSEAAALHVKTENLQSQIRDLQHQLETKESRNKELVAEIDVMKENEARHSSLVVSLRERLREAESQAGSLETAAGRSEVAISTLQKEYRDAQERISELESRLRTHLAEREEAEQKSVVWERKYHDTFSQVTSVLNISEFSELTTVETLVTKLSDIVQENALLKGKLVTLNETLQNTELETKASRETIMRLVSEVGREQQSSTKYTRELENYKLERDNALAAKRDLQEEVDMLRERLESTQRAWNATKRELEQHESRLSHLDREASESTHGFRNAASQLSAFKESLSSLLSDSKFSALSEQEIKDRIKHLQASNRDKISHVEMLEDKVQNLQRQFQSQYDFKKDSEQRARRAEADIREMSERLHKYESELAAGEVFRDGLRMDKEKYLRFLERMAEVMKMDRISAEIGFDMNGEALISRAEQLVKQEADALADRSTHIYNLQRKIKTMKQQLESKDLHMDLLRKKITQMEEKLIGRSELEKERDGETMKVRKMERLIEKQKQMLADARVEITDLKAQLMDSSNFKIRTMEQNREIEDLEQNITELEKIRHKQAKKIATMKHHVTGFTQEVEEKRTISENTVQALSDELRTTKARLDDTAQRERQLVDLRQVIAKMLGLEINTLAVPDYEIISRLEKLIQAHHTHTVNAMGLESALEDMEDGFRVGYEDSRLLLGAPVVTTTPVVRTRSRTRTRTRSPTRARSLSPRRKDTRVY